jgi:hypothetical protein
MIRVRVRNRPWEWAFFEVELLDISAYSAVLSGFLSQLIVEIDLWAIETFLRAGTTSS